MELTLKRTVIFDIEWFLYPKFSEKLYPQQTIEITKKSFLGLPFTFPTWETTLEQLDSSIRRVLSRMSVGGKIKIFLI